MEPEAKIHRSASTRASHRLGMWQKLLVFLTTTSVLAIGSLPAGAQSGSLQQGGIVAYHAIVPAEIVRGHPKDHAEAKMDGGVPNAASAHHVMVALFDDASSERIVHAKVTGTVGEVVLAPQSKLLEAFTIADALTYGNYFRLGSKAMHRFRIDVDRPSRKSTARFELQFAPG